MNAPAVPPTHRPYASPGAAEAPRLPWSRVLLRAVLVVVPGQVVGGLLATVLADPVDLRAHPGVVALFWVLPGVLAGAGLGLLFGPSPRWPWRLLGAAALVALVSLLALTFLGQALAHVVPVLTLSLAGGLLGCAAVQTGVALALWLLRRRTRMTP